uniref:BEN domain-containing protein n=1 Tax=Trichogramma kaykai TaxID=54128 RepID=A0ABD2W894_9HYME
MSARNSRKKPTSQGSTLKLSNDKCILVEFLNENNLIQTGFVEFLNQDDQKKLEEIIENKKSIIVNWPQIKIEQAQSMMKKLEKAEFKQDIVRILATGDWVSMQEASNSLVKKGKMPSETKTDRKNNAKKRAHGTSSDEDQESNTNPSAKHATKKKIQDFSEQTYSKKKPIISSAESEEKKIDQNNNSTKKIKNSKKEIEEKVYEEILDNEICLDYDDFEDYEEEDLQKERQKEISENDSTPPLSRRGSYSNASNSSISPKKTKNVTEKKAKLKCEECQKLEDQVCQLNLEIYRYERDEVKRKKDTKNLEKIYTENLMKLRDTINQTLKDMDSEVQQEIDWLGKDIKTEILEHKEKRIDEKLPAQPTILQNTVERASTSSSSSTDEFKISSKILNACRKNSISFFTKDLMEKVFSVPEMGAASITGKQSNANLARDKNLEAKPKLDPVKLSLVKKTILAQWLDKGNYEENKTLMNKQIRASMDKAKRITWNYMEQTSVNELEKDEKKQKSKRAKRKWEPNLSSASKRSRKSVTETSKPIDTCGSNLQVELQELKAHAAQRAPVQNNNIITWSKYKEKHNIVSFPIVLKSDFDQLNFLLERNNNNIFNDTVNLIKYSTAIQDGVKENLYFQFKRFFTKDLIKNYTCQKKSQKYPNKSIFVDEKFYECLQDGIHEAYGTAIKKEEILHYISACFNNANDWSRGRDERRPCKE